MPASITFQLGEESHTKLLLEIDKICYPTADYYDIGSEEDWNAIALACHSIIVKYNETIVGYLDLVRLNHNGKQAVLHGVYVDSEILQYAALTGVSTTYYLASIAILPEFRKHGTGKALLQYALNHLGADSEILATIWTPEGGMLLKNAEPVGLDRNSRQIVKLKLK